MTTVVLARGTDPGLLPRRAWRRLERAEGLWVDPTVAAEIAERLPPVPRAADPAEATVLVLNRAPAPPGCELIPDPDPALAARPGPLAGHRVVVTRAAEQSADLVDRLEDLGARVLLVPTIRIEDPEEPPRFEGPYDWVIFTSPNAPARFMAALRARGRDARWLAGSRIACIGPSTSRAVEACWLLPDLVPEEYVAEGLLRAFESHPMEGRRVLLARAAEARDVLPDGLRARGATVDVVPVYRTVAREDLPAAGLDGVDLVTVTASSVVRGFHRLTHETLPPETTPLLAIGPITARTARDLGYQMVHQADEYTLDGLVAKAVEILG